MKKYSDGRIISYLGITLVLISGLDWLISGTPVSPVEIVLVSMCITLLGFVLRLADAIKILESRDTSETRSKEIGK